MTPNTKKKDGYYSRDDIREDGLLKIAKLREREAITNPTPAKKAGK